METKSKFNHQADNSFEAIGVNQERLLTILHELKTINQVVTTKSEIAQHLIKVAKDPAEIYAVAFILGEKEACVDCPINQLGKILNL